MISGNNLWKKEYTSDMVSFNFGGRLFDTYPGLPASLYESLLATAKKFPAKTALTDDRGNSCTYLELLNRTDAFASYLAAEKKITKGSQVGILLYNSIEFSVCFLSLCKTGAVTVPLPTKYTQNEVLSLLNKTEVRTLICDADFESWFQAPSAQGYDLILSDSHTSYGLEAYTACRPVLCKDSVTLSDDAIIMFTSGTTAQSKGVLLKNYNIMHAVVSYQRLLEVTSEDISIIPIPMYHITGLIALLGLFLHVGGTLYLQKFFDAGQVLDTICSRKISFFHASPTVFSLLLQQQSRFPKLPSLTRLVCGSGGMPREKLRQIHCWLPHASFHTVYGLTETSSPGAVFPEDAGTSTHIGSSGFPIPGSRFKITDESGTELPPGEVGEIVIQGTMVLSEYYHLDTAALDKEGWLKTGDLGYFDSDGYLFVVDRKKDMINRGGEKIWSSDVENELYAIAGVKEAAVTGIPDDLYGEVAAAAVVLCEGSSLTESQIRQLLRSRIAKYKIPAKILFMDEIPVTKNLKVDKTKIKELLQKL